MFDGYIFCALSRDAGDTAFKQLLNAPYRSLSWPIAMTSADDRWRHQQSAAPHAPSHDPLTAGLPIGHEPSSSEAASYEAPSVEGGAGAANPVGAILGTAIVVILFAGPIFGTMYPLTGLSAFVAWLVTNGVLEVVAPQLGADGRLPFALLAGVIALWIMSRCDHRLADTIPAYRFWRHIARLVLTGIFVAVTSLHEFDHGFCRSHSEKSACCLPMHVSGSDSG